MAYPDVRLTYKVSMEPMGRGLLVTVDLDSPIPAELAGRAGFNLDHSLGDFLPKGSPDTDLEHLIGEGYSPMTADKVIAEPYAVGHSFTSRPDDPYSRLTITSLTGDLKLYDGRMNHNNGWFVLRTDIPAGVTAGAVRWLIEPSVVPGWTYKPVVQTSQVGYLPVQQKVAIIETDPKDTALASATLVRYDADGETAVKTVPVTEWEGDFLRYNYLKADFSDVSGSGLYRLKYGDSASPVFRIGDDIYDRGVWQPVIEYFLPVQMCHMRVTEKYRVWHDACHMDDARMAPVGNHIDGYVQPEGLTPYNALDIVEGLNAGGWHDAGDYDLRVESQSGECYILAMAWEAFHP